MEERPQHAIAEALVVAIDLVGGEVDRPDLARGIEVRQRLALLGGQLLGVSRPPDPQAPCRLMDAR